MMPGLDPAQLARAQELGSHVKAVIKTNYNNKIVEVSFKGDTPEMEAFIDQLLRQFSTSLATQLSSFFNISGEIIEEGHAGEG